MYYILSHLSWKWKNVCNKWCTCCSIYSLMPINNINMNNIINHCWIYLEHYLFNGLKVFKYDFRKLHCKKKERMKEKTMHSLLLVFLRLAALTNIRSSLNGNYDFFMKLNMKVQNKNWLYILIYELFIFKTMHSE